MRIFLDSCGGSAGCMGRPSGRGLTPPYLDNIVTTLALAREGYRWDDVRFREYVYSLLQRCSRRGVSLLMTLETPQLFGVTHISDVGVSHLSDNVVLLQYVREQSQLSRALTVFKTRASHHDPSIRYFHISPEGIALGGALDEGSVFGR